MYMYQVKASKQVQFDILPPRLSALTKIGFVAIELCHFVHEGNIVHLHRVTCGRDVTCRERLALLTYIRPHGVPAWQRHVTLGNDNCDSPSENVAQLSNKMCLFFIRCNV